MRLFYIVAVIIAVAGPYSIAQAQETTASPTETREAQTQKTRVSPIQVREEATDLKKETVDTLKVRAQEKRAEVRGAIDENREAVKGIREKAKEEIDEKKDSLRERLTNDKKEVREERTLQREEKATQLAERKKEQDAKRIERIKAYFEKSTGRLGAAIERLEKLAERVESRAQKLATEKGVDVSKTRELLGIAKTKIADAKAAIGQIRTEVLAMFEGEAEPRVVFEKVKGLLETAKESVKAAHRALVEAIASLKASAGLRDDVPKTEKTEAVETNE